jgi:hypothetical protein
MKEKIINIIDALRELQVECLKATSAKDELYWVDHFIDEARANMKRALKSLESRHESD